MKIFANITNNPSNTQKYGNLHLNKITNKLSTCQPVFKLLLLSGFEAKENNKRLIWTNTNENMIILKHIQNTLKSMIAIIPMTNNDITPNQQELQTSNQQTQQDIAQMVTNLILNPNAVEFITNHSLLSPIFSINFYHHDKRMTS